MPELTLQRIPITVESDNRLRMLKARTGINPNILCRIGLCLSLEEPSPPPNLITPFKTAREINRYTLLGRYDEMFVALLVTRAQRDILPLEEVDTIFLKHIVRGVEILATRIKSVGELERCIHFPQRNLQIPTI